ncbi:hypothetical protein EDF68_1011002 [Ochrobactrum sp. BH3]|nr:hypothetical protein EDF68_1011002 [Ochrobactrum sp. BH3]
MAFKIRALARYNTAPVDTGRNCNFYSYATDDAKATVLTAGYFNDARSTLKVNDIIDVVAVHNGTGAHARLIVTAVPGSGNITVADTASA